MKDKLLRRRQVEEMTGLSRSSIYRLMRIQKFPFAIKVGPSAVRWKESDITSWLESRSLATGEHGSTDAANVCHNSLNQGPNAALLLSTHPHDDPSINRAELIPAPAVFNLTGGISPTASDNGLPCFIRDGNPTRIVTKRGGPTENF